MESARSVVASTEIDPGVARELLDRPAIEIDSIDSDQWLTGQRVLITGAGGSIGAPLGERVAAGRSEALMLIDRDPEALAQAERRATARNGDRPKTAVRTRSVDIADRVKMAGILAAFAPDVILHAAASKHLPLVEQDPLDGVRNNLLATSQLATLADQVGVGTFVFLSTDKAAAPTSVMGATKRAAESFCRDIAQRSATRFVAVRFGNVLGSSGSVVPLFRAQIDVGGPITLTHMDARRFFITIEEAVQLILHAGATAGSGETLVLDSGPAVRIRELADRLIRNRGLEVADIGVRVTALRAGEKLCEVLVGPDEVLVETGIAGVLRAELIESGSARQRVTLEPMQAAVDQGDARRALEALACLVPGFGPRTEQSDPAR
jgi:FlaA1/EpsC-like NDP-sugar epimerase